MGIGKKAGKTVAKTKAKGTVQNATEDIPVVGGMVDKNVKAGPMDRAGDQLDRTKDKLPGGEKNDGIVGKATDAASDAAGAVGSAAGDLLGGDDKKKTDRGLNPLKRE